MDTQDENRNIFPSPLRPPPFPARTVKAQQLAPESNAGDKEQRLEDSWEPLDLDLLCGAEGSKAGGDFEPAMLGHPTLESWVVQIADAHRVTRAMAWLALMIVMATALGVRVVARVTPNWAEPGILWGLLVGPPGSRKTPLLRFCAGLLRPMEHHELLRWQADAATAEAEAQRLKADWRDYRREKDQAARKGLPDPRPPVREPASIDIPLKPGILLGSPTIEAAMELAAGSPRGLLAMPDEAASLLPAGGNGGTARAAWLKATSGQPVSVERISRPSRSIPQFAVSILTGTQPDVLPRLIGAIDDGFLGRFLTVWPKTLPAPGIWRGEIAVDAMRAALEDLRRAGEASADIRLSDEAIELLEEKMAIWDVIAEEVGGLAAGFYRKADGHAVRIALVVAVAKHVIDHGAGLPDAITLDDMDVAIELVDKVFSAGSRRASERVEKAAGLTMAQELLEHIRRARQSVINTRRIQRHNPGRFGDTKAFKEAIDELVAAMVIRQVARPVGKLGRSRTDYEVHPDLR